MNKMTNKTHIDYMTNYFGTSEPDLPIVKVFNSPRARRALKVFNGVKGLEKWLTENGREILNAKNVGLNVFEANLA